MAAGKMMCSLPTHSRFLYGRSRARQHVVLSNHFQGVATTMFLSLSIKLTSATIKAIAYGLAVIVRAFDKYPGGAVLLSLAIVAIGTATAISRIQIVMT